MIIQKRVDVALLVIDQEIDDSTKILQNLWSNFPELIGAATNEFERGLKTGELEIEINNLKENIALLSVLRDILKGGKQ